MLFKPRSAILILVVLFLVLVPVFFSHAVTCTPGEDNSSGGGLCNPIQADSLQDLLFRLIKYFGYFAGSMTVIGVVVSGFMMIMAQGNSEKLETAKSSLQWTLSGFIVVLFSFIIVSATKTFLGVQDIPTSAYNDSISNQPINPFGETANFGTLIDTMVLGFTGVVGLIAVLMLIINGVKYMTAAGNDEQATAAKTGIQWSVVGIILVVLAYVIVRALATFFGAR